MTTRAAASRTECNGSDLTPIGANYNRHTKCDPKGALALYEMKLMKLESPHSLRPEWDALCLRAGPHYVARTFLWNLICWETVAAPRGRELICLIGRSDGRIVMIWPFSCYHEKGVRIVRPLSAESSEYNTVLIEAGQNEELLISQAIALLRSKRMSDVLEVPWVHGGSSLHRALSQARSIKVSYTQPSPWISWDGVGDWKAFYRGSLSKKHRENRARQRKHLSSMGDVCFQHATDPEHKDRLVRWLVDRKREWLAHQNERSDWIPTEEYLAFLTRAVREQSESIGIFVLSVDGVPVAAELSAINNWCVEMFICSYDPSFSKYSPGELLREECLEWAYQRGLSYDFRIGREHYKGTWANREATVYDYHVALSPRGIGYIAVHWWPDIVRARMRRAVGKRLSPHWKDRLKHLLRLKGRLKRSLGNWVRR